MRYTVVFEKGPASYGAHLPDLPGCVAVGDSLEEVKELIREAAKLIRRHRVQPHATTRNHTQWERVDRAGSPGRSGATAVKLARLNCTRTPE